MDYLPTRRQVVQGMGAVGLGLLAGCGSVQLPGYAVPSARAPRIGFLSPYASDERPLAFREGLQELGYIEGQNVSVEYRFGDGDPERLPTLAQELVALPVDIIVATGPAVRAVRAATNTIPIVIGAALDPVGDGHVASFARPGGIITGSTLMSGGLPSKRLEILNETLARPLRVAVLGTLENQVAAAELAELETAARALGLQVFGMDMRRPDEIEAILDNLLRERPDALLLLLHSPAVTIQSRRIHEFAVQQRLPSMGPARIDAANGGLLAYGPNHAQLHHRAAYFVDRILKGTKPADLPVEQPMRFDFVINARTAQALGLTLPHHVLLQATEVIQ
jgi:putative ABC transport system substrate-binding protein